MSQMWKESIITFIYSYKKGLLNGISKLFRNMILSTTLTYYPARLTQYTGGVIEDH
jgi:hypothetical protein